MELQNLIGTSKFQIRLIKTALEPTEKINRFLSHLHVITSS